MGARKGRRPAVTAGLSLAVLLSIGACSQAGGADAHIVTQATVMDVPSRATTTTAATRHAVRAAPTTTTSTTSAVSPTSRPPRRRSASTTTTEPPLTTEPTPTTTDRRRRRQPPPIRDHHAPSRRGRAPRCRRPSSRRRLPTRATAGASTRPRGTTTASARAATAPTTPGRSTSTATTRSASTTTGTGSAATADDRPRRRRHPGGAAGGVGRVGADRRRRVRRRARALRRVWPAPPCAPRSTRAATPSPSATCGGGGRCRSFDGLPLSVDVTVPCAAAGRPAPPSSCSTASPTTRRSWEETGKSDTVLSRDRPQSNDRWNNIWFASAGLRRRQLHGAGLASTRAGPTPSRSTASATSTGSTSTTSAGRCADAQWLAGGLVQSGVADPARLAITGGSYGGAPTAMAALLAGTVVCGGAPTPAALGPDPLRRAGRRVEGTVDDAGRSHPAHVGRGPAALHVQRPAPGAGAERPGHRRVGGGTAGPTCRRVRALRRAGAQHDRRAAGRRGPPPASTPCPASTPTPTSSSTAPA